MALRRKIKRKAAKKANPRIRAAKKTKKSKKKPNPRIRKKPQKRPAKQKRPTKRSQAAKRGWETRRRKELEKKIAIGERRQRRKNPKLMKALERARLAELALIQEKQKTEKYLKEVAKLQREYEARDKLVERMIAVGQLVESDETRIIARLRLAEIDGAFEEEVGMLADEFDMQPHEIYTLWMSP